MRRFFFCRTVDTSRDDILAEDIRRAVRVLNEAKAQAVKAGLIVYLEHADAESIYGSISVRRINRVTRTEV